jgi:threonine/homoserine/homoserine lactone efflux protein
MIEIVFKGIIVGILVSAPMGPIGLMCIQRTLNKGQWHGFFSGVGAALSDLFYALITSLGMGIVINFIENNQYILQILGSILLFIFGLYTFQTNPSKSLQKPNEKGGGSYSQDTITAFLLTLSNPLIIFLFIALFARFNFIDPEKTVYSIIIGLLSIVLGALTWWFFVTALVGKLRMIINVRGLWILNKGVGVVIMFSSLLGIISSALGYHL